MGSSSHPYITEWLCDNIYTVSTNEVSIIVKIGDCTTEMYSVLLHDTLCTKYNQKRVFKDSPKFEFVKCHSLHSNVSSVDILGV